MSGGYWGYHAMFDCHGSNKKIQDRDIVITFCKDLVQRIDMDPIGEPWCEQTAMHDPGKAGFTLTQIIQTSSIVAHFIDEPGDIYLDVFSCKEFNIDIVEDCIRDYFHPTKIRTYFITRHAG
jgi:S-adenosylmethionine/arginine decarboxylase-like enzyme